MTTSQLMKCLRIIALAAVLAVPTVTLHAPWASAKPASTQRKDCSGHLNQYKADVNLAKAYTSYAQTLLSLGYTDEAQQATTWAEAYYDLAQDAIGKYAACL